MKTRILFLAVVLFFTCNFIFAQVPTYTLKVDSMRLVDIPPYEDNAIEFGIYLTHTNSAPFTFAGGQYFFSFNPNILPCTNLTDTTSCVRYRIIGSQIPPPYQPRNPSISTAINPSATIMRLAINAGFGFGLDLTGATNILVVRMRLTSKAGPFNQTDLSMAFRNPPIVTFATRLFAYVNDVNTDITTPETHSIDSSGLATSFPKLQLRIIPEGLYDPSSNSLMRRDIVTVYLRNIFSPYNIVDSSSRFIDTISFSNRLIFNNASTGIYYVVSKHFNSLETWSKSGGEQFNFGDTTFYDFTTSASQAFGNNMKLKGSKYTIYSGDINRDGVIDGSDFSALYNDAIKFTQGIRLPTDLNADNIVDGSDYLIVDNNSFNFVSVMKP